jgi:hypothetical protein
MPNNILITPGSASIQFSGSAANTIQLQVESSGSVAFYGNSGSLFSIVDQLSGSLMSVNDVSGLPILEVFSDDRVVMGTLNQNTLVVTGSRVGVRKGAPTANVDVSGSVVITGSLNMNSGGITGSLFGTSSFATTASFALNASGGGSAFPFSGSAVITGSLLVSGSGVTITGSLQTDRYSLGLVSLGNASGSMSINLNNGNYFTATTTAATNWSITNTPSNRAVGFVLALTSGGAQTQTWPSEVKWPNATAPTLTAAGQDTLTFITDNGGTTWRGVLSIKDSR